MLVPTTLRLLNSPPPPPPPPPSPPPPPPPWLPWALPRGAGKNPSTSSQSAAWDADTGADAAREDLLLLVEFIPAHQGLTLAHFGA